MLEKSSFSMKEQGPKPRLKFQAGLPTQRKHPLH